MPRASWRGFLRLSLVTCPVYLSPATTGTKPIRLRQVWQPAPVEVNEDALPDRSAGQQGSASSAPQLATDHTNPEAAQSRAATRIALRPHDPGTGEEIDKREIVKGYEYGRGQFVTLTSEELKALDVESSKVIDLEKFVLRGQGPQDPHLGRQRRAADAGRRPLRRDPGPRWSRAGPRQDPQALPSARTLLGRRRLQRMTS